MLLRALSGRAIFACGTAVVPVVRRGEALVVVPVALTGAPIEADLHHEAPLALVRSRPREASRIDLDTGAAQPMPLPSETCALRIDPLDASRAIALGADGRVRTLDAAGVELAGFGVSAPFACDAPDRPRMAVAPEHAFVGRSDGVLVDVDWARGATREIAIGHPASDVAVFGVEPENMNASVGAH